MKQLAKTTSNTAKSHRISLSLFQAEMGAYRKYTLSGDDPLIPISLTAEFDHIAVCISASPYIALSRGSTQICLSHIDTIRRNSPDEVGQTYTILCKDYSGIGTPADTKLLLRCA